MGYRDDLGAARTRISQLEGDYARLEKVKAPDVASRNRFHGSVAVALVTFVVAFALLAKLGKHEAVAAHEEANALSGRVQMLRQESRDLQRRSAELKTEVNAGERFVEERRYQLAQLDARITDRRRQLDLPAAASVPAASPVRPRRLTEAQIATRLALCKAYPESPGRYPYAEGVVIGIEEVLDLSTHNGWGVVIPEVHQIVHLTVPGRGEVVVDPCWFPRDENRDTQLTNALFWNRVEVGDILGISWNTQDSGTKSQILRIRTTGK